MFHLRGDNDYDKTAHKQSLELPTPPIPDVDSDGNAASSSRCHEFDDYMAWFIDRGSTCAGP
jgi:hypothetical protein